MTAASTRRILPLIVACLLPAAGWCIQLTVPLVNQKPVIDGQVTTQEQAGAVSSSLTKIGGLDHPRYPTQVFVSATLDGLYIGFIAQEPDMDTLVTSITQENGAVFNDDSVQVLITPSLDTAADAYYHFAVNPAGTRYSNHLITGDVVQDWQSAVSKAGDKWEAEFFIPLTSIKAPDELPLWRANFARVRPARGSEQAETSAWVNPGISLHNYKKFGYLTMPRFVPPAPATTQYTTTPVEVITTETIRRQRNQSATSTPPTSSVK